MGASVGVGTVVFKRFRKLRHIESVSIILESNIDKK